MKHSTWMSWVVGATAFGLFAAGCSLDAPHSGGSLKIVIDDPNQNAAAAAPLLSAFQTLSSGFGVLGTTPTSTADFSCFAVNVTGVGIPANGAFAKDCTSSTGFHGTGPGILSKPTVRGTAIQLDVAAGNSRTIDVYGISPPAQECGAPAGSGGGGGGYFLGRVTQPLAVDATVSVSISYAGAAPEIVCTGGGNQGLGVWQIFPYRGLNAAAFPIMITGSGFLPTAIVKIGTTPCPVTTVTPNQITCTVPSGISLGTYSVTVDNQNGTAATTQTPYFQIASSGALLSIDANTADLQFGSVPVGSSKDIIVHIMNTGSSPATVASVPGPLSAPFSFKGGTWPGVGGTCPAALGTLAGGAPVCSVVMTFSPIAIGAVTSGVVTIFSAPSMAFTQFSGTGI